MWKLWDIIVVNKIYRWRRQKQFELIISLLQHVFRRFNQTNNTIRKKIILYSSQSLENSMLSRLFQFLDISNPLDSRSSSHVIYKVYIMPSKIRVINS